MALALQAEQNDGDCVAEAMGNVERPAKGSYRTSTTATGTAKENTEMAKQEKKDIEDVSFFLFVRAAPDASTALWYAAREAAATGLPIEITEAALETRCLNTDVNTLATISKGSGGMAKGLLATADRVHKEHDLRIRFSIRTT